MTGKELNQSIEKDFLAEVKEEMEKGNIHGVVISHVIKFLGNLKEMGITLEQIDLELHKSHPNFVERMNYMGMTHEFLKYENFRDFSVNLYMNDDFWKEYPNE
jgi:hypothetical protein